MKRFILSAAFLLTMFTAFGQSKIVKDAQGNYKTEKATEKAKVQDKKTDKTFTDSKGNVWPVYQTATGRVYALRTSKSGKEYKQYLDKEK